MIERCWCGAAGVASSAVTFLSWEILHEKVESCCGCAGDRLFAAWYAFRPEGLFIDRQVEEGMPTAKGGASLEPVASGVFHGVAHPKPRTSSRGTFL